MKEIRKIIDAYDSWKEQQQSMALATVVKVEESSYRRIGARMLVSASGLFVGGISGGCLEGNALKKAQLAIHKNAVCNVVYDTLEDDEHQIGVGLGCNGRIEILFTPINLSDPSNPIELLRKIIEADQPAILLKIIAAEHDDLLGKNHLLVNDFSVPTFGNLSRHDLTDAIQLTRSRKKPRVFSLTNDENENIELLVEYLRPETRLIIFGNNYDVNALIGIAKELGWKLSVVGKKEKILTSISKNVENIFDYSEVEDLLIDEYTAIILMTHDYNWDKKMLPHLVDQQQGYLGILGPRKRFDKLNEELVENGQVKGLLNYPNIFAPIGLDIGAESPEEIALSVTAEIISVFRQRDARPLKYRIGTIHERES